MAEPSKERQRKEVRACDDLSGFEAEVLEGLVDAGSLNLDLGGYSAKVAIGDNMYMVRQIIREYGLDAYSVESVVWGMVKGEQFSVNESETKALCWLQDSDDLGFETLKRRESPDFVLDGRVGVEVKSSEDYKISRKQLKAASRLARTHIVLSNSRYCKVLDTIDWLGLNEYRRLFDKHNNNS